MNQKCRSRRALNSFTLIELLVVLAIITILAALTIPSIFSLLRSSSLNSGSNSLVNQLNLARQTAIAKNCQVEFRLYELPGNNTAPGVAPSVYRAFQGFSLDNNSSQTNAITKPIFLPNQVYMATGNSGGSNVSSLLSPTPTAGTVAGISVDVYPPSDYNYISFHFKPDGTTDLNPSVAQPSYITLANQGDPVNSITGLPANFITIEIDALTGRVRYFRPN